MNIKIGEILKTLRKKNDVTQEKLATALGVTSQAISRWENRNGYPDVEYIPAIANFFNVSIDVLFDHDTSEKQHKIDAYIAEYNEMARRWEKPEIEIAYLRKALAEFHGEERLLSALANSLYFQFCASISGSNDAEGYFIPDYEEMRKHDGWEEAVAIMEELLASTHNSEIRHICEQLLVFIYGYIGELEKAKIIADQTNDIFDCQNMLLESLYGKEGERYRQENLIIFYGLMWQNMRSIELNLNIGIDERISTVEAYLAFGEVLFSDKNYGFVSVTIAEMHRDLAGNYIRKGNFDSAFNHLGKALSLIRIFDELHEKKSQINYSAPFIRLAKTDSSKWSAIDDRTKNFKSDIETSKTYAPIRNDKRYFELMK